MADWKIGNVEFGVLKVVSAVLTVRVLEADELVITTAERVDVLDLFSAYQQVLLVDPLGVVRWTGWLDMQKYAAAGNAEGKSLSFSCAKRFLDYRYYTDLRRVVNTTTNTLINMSDLRVGGNYLGAELEWARVSVADAYQDIVACWTAEGLPMWLRGALPALQVPVMGVSCVTYSTVLRNIMSWFPAYILVSDGVEMTVVNSDTTADVWVSIAAGGLAEASFFPRYDLLCSLTTLEFIKVGETAIYDVQTRWAATENSSPRHMYFSHRLGSDEDWPSEGIVDQLQAYYGALKLQGSVKWVGLRWDVRPGMGVRVMPPLPSYGVSRSVCHTITRNLLEMTCKMDCGPVPGASFDSLLSLAAKRMKPQGNSVPITEAPTAPSSPAQTAPGGGGGDGGGGGGGFPPWNPPGPPPAPPDPPDPPDPPTPPDPYSFTISGEATPHSLGGSWIHVEVTFSLAGPAGSSMDPNSVIYSVTGPGKALDGTSGHITVGDTKTQVRQVDLKFGRTTVSYTVSTLVNGETISASCDVEIPKTRAKYPLWVYITGGLPRWGCGAEYYGSLERSSSTLEVTIGGVLHRITDDWVNYPEDGSNHVWTPDLVEYYSTVEWKALDADGDLVGYGSNDSFTSEPAKCVVMGVSMVYRACP